MEFGAHLSPARGVVPRRRAAAHGDGAAAPHLRSDMEGTQWPKYTDDGHWLSGECAAFGSVYSLGCPYVNIQWMA